MPAADRFYSQQVASIRHHQRVRDFTLGVIFGITFLVTGVLAVGGGS